MTSEVVLEAVVAAHHQHNWHVWLRQLSATGSIGFAVGSQKLFLNIRHELRDRRQAPVSLALALAVFGATYILICWAAGPNPPSFLFDAIPAGTKRRRIGGVLLWIHVVVSYVINAQALCSSMDRLLWRRWTTKLCACFPSSCTSTRLVDSAPATRWMILTFVVGVAAYLVANAVPFFTDLVALIGAVTSVPLTLLLPALFWRQHLQVALLGRCCSWGGGNGGANANADMPSLALTYFAIVFMIAATIGAINVIALDWSTHGPPFACY